MVGAQSTYDLSPHIGLVGSLNWMRPTTKLVTTDATTNVYQADLGLEVGGAKGSTTRWAMWPFADVGGAMRRYAFSNASLDDRTRGGAFAALGTDVSVGRTAIRLAATDNLFSYEAPTADATHSTRNDVGLTIGFRFRP